MTATIALPRQQPHSDWLAKLRQVGLGLGGRGVLGLGLGRSAVSAAAGNGLLNSLVAYWPGNETSGNLLDAHTNALHLTDNNTVTNAAGKVYATARQYTAANVEYHRSADNSLAAGDTDLTLAAWVYRDTINAAVLICDRAYFSVGRREFTLSTTSDNLFRWRVFNGGTTVVAEVLASTYGAHDSGVWYLVVASHDAGNNQASIQINNGPVDSAATSGAPGSLVSMMFTIGAFGFNSSTGSDNWNGRIGPVAMWKSAAGGGGVLTADQRSALYNSGNGLAYAEFTT